MLALSTEVIMIAGSSLLSLLIGLVVAGLIFWLVIWFVDYCGVPDPFNKVIKVICGLFVLIYLVNVLLGIGGHPLIR